jgi:hypothetical protein
MRQGATLKHGHERGRKGREPLEGGLERAFATDGVAEQKRAKGNDFLVAKPATDQAHLRPEGLEQPVSTQQVGDEDRLGKLARHGGLWLL